MNDKNNNNNKQKTNTPPHDPKHGIMSTGPYSL